MIYIYNSNLNHSEEYNKFYILKKVLQNLILIEEFIFKDKAFSLLNK